MYYVIPCTYIYTGRYGGPLHSSSQPSLYTVQNMSNSSGEFEPNFWGTERPNDYHNLDFVLTTPELIRKAVDDAIHEALYLEFGYISQLITVKLIQTEIHCWCCAMSHCGVLSYPASDLPDIVDGAVQQAIARSRDVMYSEENECFVNTYIFEQIENEGNCDLDDVYCICDCCR